MASRDRTIDAALRVTPRRIRLATAAVIALGIAAFAWALFTSDDRARAREVRRLGPGVDTASVIRSLAAPPGRCPVGNLEHLRTRFPDDFAPAALDATLDRMREETAQRWVYPSGDASARCAPRDGDTEIGIGRDGRVLWLVPVTGRNAVRLPPAYSPNPGES